MRTYIPLPDYDLRLHVNNEPAKTAYILSVRDTLRLALDADDLHTDWMIGDVAQWPALTYFGYAFVIYHMVAGVKSGPAWMFAFPGTYTSGSGTVDIDDIIQNAPFSSYGRDSNGGTTISTNGNFFVHYCETGGTTDPYSIGYDLDGHLTGGDLDLPTINPYTNLAGFMPPSTKLYGVVPLGFSDTRYPNTWSILADPTKPFLCMYMADGPLPRPSSIYIMGEVLDPIRPADPYKSAVCWWNITTSATITGTVSSRFTWTYNDVGTRIQCTDYPHAAHRHEKGYWDKITVANSTFVKGFFDPDVLRVVGAWNQGQQVVYDTYFKATSDMGFPYLADTPTFPY